MMNTNTCEFCKAEGRICQTCVRPTCWRGRPSGRSRRLVGVGAAHACQLVTGMHVDERLIYRPARRVAWEAGNAYREEQRQALLRRARR